MAEHVPFSISYGLHPQVSRPKSQTLRVEKGSGAAPVPVVEAISRGSTPATSPARTVTPKRTPEALGASMSGGSKGSSPMSDSKPAFVEHAGKRLQFTAWTAEAVHESAAETARIRHYVITYFPEDGSLMVTEPPVANSGLPGASILRRSHVPKKALAPPEEASFVSLPGDSGDAAAGPGETVGPQDIHIGEHLSLYGRVYHVASATPFTRTWLAEQMGIELAPDEPLPADPYTAAKEASMRRDAGFTGTLSSLRGVAVGGAGGSPGGFDGSRSGGFAASGGGSGHGTPGSSTYHGREMTSIKRFLEASRGSTSAVLTKGVRDKTAQWRAHDSRDALKFKGIIDERDKEGGLRLPVTVAYYLADDAVEVTIVRSPGDGLGRFSCLWKRAPLPKGLIWHDSRPRDVESDKGEEDYVTADDLRVGSTLHLMGRTVLLHDADEETYEWYARNRGLDMRGGAVDVTERPPPAPVAPLPPKLPYGTEEDSLGSVYSLQPKRPKTDWKRVWALDGQKIAFHARLAEPKTPADSERVFTVTFELASGTLAIFEPPRPNSGYLGGHFLSKQKVRNPDAGRDVSAEDLYPGAILNVNSTLFELMEPDSRTAKMLGASPSTSAASSAAPSPLRDSLPSAPATLETHQRSRSSSPL